MLPVFFHDNEFIGETGEAWNWFARWKFDQLHTYIDQLMYKLSFEELFWIRNIQRVAF